MRCETAAANCLFIYYVCVLLVGSQFLTADMLFFFWQLKSDYIQMLKEMDLDKHSRWSETKKKIDGESRYKAVESSSRREDWFRDYIKNLHEVSIHIEPVLD